MKQIKVSLPARWTDGGGIDSALNDGQRLFDSKAKSVTFVVPTGCALKIGACIRLLSIVNQLAYLGAHVEIFFEEGQLGAMGYLSRMGFFEHLAPAVAVTPDRPDITGRQMYGGGNRGLIEIASLSTVKRDMELPDRLAKTAAALHSDKTRGERLGDAVFTVFSELIGNVYDHSATKLTGFAALQSYSKGRKGRTVEIAVSDSGLGILATLRPALLNQGHPYGDLDDAELLIKAVSEGVSKNGPGYGCGLHISAQKALILSANLEIRLPECRMNLVPKATEYTQETMVYGYDGLPHIDGTHLCFDFYLDN